MTNDPHSNDDVMRIGSGPDEIQLSEAEVAELLNSLRTDLGDDDFTEMMGQLTADEGANVAARGQALQSFEAWAQSRPEFRQLFIAGNVSEVVQGIFQFMRAMLGFSIGADATAQSRQQGETEQP